MAPIVLVLTLLAVMMQHSDAAVTYTRWGRNTCPEQSQLVYAGYMASGNYNQQGSGSNFLCLHSSPDWGNYSPLTGEFWTGQLHGTQYIFFGPYANGLPFSTSNNRAQI